ncbi:MAG: hypothetical protein RLZZ15_2556 [Verrucomicrobiota bacterium]|jgi:hypothetical protein
MKANPAVIAVLAAASAIHFGGCATARVEATSRGAPAISPGRISTRVDLPVETDLGAVVLARNPLRAELQFERLPPSRAEAWRAGPGRVLEEIEHRTVGSALGGGIFLLPAVLGLDAAGGWIHGAVSGVDGDELRRITAALAKAGGEFALVERLTATVLARAADYPARSVTLHRWQLPQEPSTIRQRLRAATTGTVGPPPPPHPLAAEGIDTVAVLAVGRHALCGTGEPDSQFELRLHVTVRLQRTRDWSEAGSFAVEYVSAPQPLAAWAQDDAWLLRHDWDAAVAGLEQQITDTLARRATPPLSHP